MRSLEERVLRTMREIDDIQRRHPDAPWTRPPDLGRALTRQWLAFNTPRYHWLPREAFIRWLSDASSKVISANRGDGTT